MSHKIGYYRENMRYWHKRINLDYSLCAYDQREIAYEAYKREFGVIRNLVFSVLISFDE